MVFNYLIYAAYMFPVGF